MSEMEEYRQEFLQEAREYLDVMNQNFIKLESGDLDAINEVFRVAHTIKGMAGFMGYKNLENLCHKLEISSDLVDVMLKAVDAIEEILERIEESGSDDVSIDDIVEELQSYLKTEEKVEAKHIDFGGANYRVDVTLAEDCVMKSVRAALVVETISEVAEVLGTDPGEEEMDSDSFDGRFSVYIKTERPELVEEAMSRVAEVDKFEVVELKVEKPKKEEKVEKSGKDKERDLQKKGRKLDSVRVNISQLDTIMNLVGELVISKGRLLQIAQQYDIPELREAISIMDKSITSLQDEIMRIRMVRVERVFNKFPRMVRDLARKLGKKVEFVMEGLETELDRTVLDEISDPLIHLIRNAVDHGIEPPEERKAAGKSEVGRIRLTAWRERNNIIIEVEDDGRGIDIEKVKRKAVEKGMITQSEAEAMSDDEAMMLIFTPGFSTRDQVTEVSGRGVGMDVVKTTVEKLGGTLKIYSERGKGTKIRIQLPPTVAIVKSLLVKVGSETYAIPISSVLEALYVDETNWKVIHGNAFLIVRGKLIPAFKLRDLFGVNGGKPEREVGIVVEKEGERVALIADAISDQQEIVIKPLTGFLSKIKGFSGVTILGDGRVVPIIDVTSLLGGDVFGSREAG